MHYDTGKHCVFHHRYHIVWSTKYRCKVLTGRVRLRVRGILRQVCRENEVDIPRGVLSSDHVHMFVSVPPKIAIPDPVRGMKGRSSHKVQREFPALRRRYWGRRFRGRGYFSATNRAITEDIVPQYPENHIADPTGTSRWGFSLVVCPTQVCPRRLFRSTSLFAKSRPTSGRNVPPGG